MVKSEMERGIPSGVRGIKKGVKSDRPPPHFADGRLPDAEEVGAGDYVYF